MQTVPAMVVEKNVKSSRSRNIVSRNFIPSFLEYPESQIIKSQENKWKYEVKANFTCLTSNNGSQIANTAQLLSPTFYSKVGNLLQGRFNGVGRG